MAEKIGEMLIRNGLISAEQLEAALEAQLTFGGRLGTNLIELGFVGAATLADFLARRLKLPALDPQGLEAVSPEAIARLPRPVAEKYAVLPLELDGRTLQVAMADPTDLNAIDAIAFATGCRIKPVVAPELLLVYGLEKYYGIQRKTRFIRLAADESPSSGSGPARRASPFSDDVPKSPAAVDSARQSYELSDAVRELAQATKPRSILLVLLRYLASRFERVAILAIDGGKARGWSQIGCMPPPETGSADPFHDIDFPESVSPLLSKANESEVPFLEPQSDGQAEDVDALAWLLWKAGSADPLLVIPIRYGDRLVAVALARGELAPGALAAREAYELLARRSVLALDLVRLRERILRL